MVLMRTDPFHELDRWTQQVLGTAARPAVMPLDAWREGDQFVVEFDLPGVNPDSLDLDVERNVLTVRAERPDLDQGKEMVSAERPRGVFSRQLFLGENLDTDKIEAALPRWCSAACDSGRRTGEAPPHRDQPQRASGGDQRLSREPPHRRDVDRRVLANVPDHDEEVMRRQSKRQR